MSVVLIIVEVELCGNLLGRSNLCGVEGFAAVNQLLLGRYFDVWVFQSLETIHSLIQIMHPQLDVPVVRNQTHLLENEVKSVVGNQISDVLLGNDLAKLVIGEVSNKMEVVNGEVIRDSVNLLALPE